jgi:hypothetical protein
MRQYKITLGEMRSGKIDAMERVDAPVKTAFAASHKMARRGGEKLIWYVTIDGVTNLPVLLDFLTVFFIVAGCALLWLNLRRRRPRVVVTKTDDAHQSVSTPHLPDDAEIRALLAALKPPASDAQADPEAKEDNAYESRVAKGNAKGKKPPS